MSCFVYSKKAFVLIAAILFCLSCGANKNLIGESKDASREKEEKSHETYQYVIVQNPDNPNPYMLYAHWAPDKIERQALDIKHSFEGIKEASRIKSSLVKFDKLLKELDEIEAFLTEHQNPNVPEFAEALAYFKGKKTENQNLINYVRTNSERKIKASYIRSNQETQLGKKEYYDNNLEEAYSHFALAIEYNTENNVANTYQANIKAFFKVSDYIAERRLDEAEALLIKLLEAKALVQMSREKMAMLRLKKQQVTGLLRQADFQFRRRQFANATATYDRAMELNVNIADDVATRKEAATLSNSGWTALNSKNYIEAISFFSKANEKWPEQADVSRWLKAATNKKREADTATYLKDAEASLLAGDTKKAEKSFTLALESTISAKKTKRSIDTIKKNGEKYFQKEAAKAKKSKHLLNQWLAYDRCAQCRGNKSCKKKAEALAKELGALFFEWSKEGDWPDKFVSAKAATQIVPTLKQYADQEKYTAKIAKANSQLLFFPLDLNSSQTPPSQLPIQPFFAKQLDSAGLSWRWAMQEDDITTCQYCWILRSGPSPEVVSAPTLPGWSDAQAVPSETNDAPKGKEKDNEITPIGTLSGLLTKEGQLTAWSWSENNALEEASVLLSATFQEKLGQADDNMSLEGNVRRLFIFQSNMDDHWLDLATRLYNMKIAN